MLPRACFVVPACILFIRIAASVEPSTETLRTEIAKLQLQFNKMQSSFLDDKKSREFLETEVQQLNLKNQKLKQIEATFTSLRNEIKLISERYSRLKSVVWWQYGKILKHQRDCMATNAGKAGNEAKKTEKADILKETSHDKEVKSKIQRRLIQDIPRQVAFTADVTTVPTHLGRGQTIHFDNVKTNLGHAFQAQTGIFSVVVPGWYIFSLSLKTHYNSEQELHIMSDGIELARCWAKGAYMSDSQIVVTHLNTGSDVWVETHRNLDLSDTVDGDHHTSFSGFLLYPDE